MACWKWRGLKLDGLYRQELKNVSVVFFFALSATHTCRCSRESVVSGHSRVAVRLSLSYPVGFGYTFDATAGAVRRALFVGTSSWLRVGLVYSQLKKKNISEVSSQSHSLADFSFSAISNRPRGRRSPVTATLWVARSRSRRASTRRWARI